MGHLVICNAEVSAADADTRLLHQPLGQGFWLLLAAADGISVDVVTPPARPRRQPREFLRRNRYPAASLPVPFGRTACGRAK